MERLETAARWLILALVIGPIGTLLVQRYAEGAPYLPTRGAMLHPFGAPVSYQSCGFLTGQDWFAPAGTAIHAVEAGTVLYVGPLWVSGEGVGRGDYSIILYHEDETGAYYTTYSHNRAALVQPGDVVERGETCLLYTSRCV